MCLRYASAGLFSVERLGRKPLLVGSLVVMVVGLCLLAVAFLLMHPEDVAISGAEIGKEAVSNSVYFTCVCLICRFVVPSQHDIQRWSGVQYWSWQSSRCELQGVY